MVEWRGVRLIIATMAVGIPIGALILRSYRPTPLLVALGVVLLLAGTTLFLAPATGRFRWPRGSPGVLGFISGILTGLFGTGGPPLILYYQLSGTPKSAFRSNLMTIFLFSTFIRAPTYLLTGLITWPRIVSGLLLMPAVAAATWLGHHVHARMPEATFQRLVSIAIGILGVMLVVRNL